MNTQDAAPEKVNLLRRFLAVVVFMVGFPCVVMCMPWRQNGKNKDRLEKIYNWLIELVLKLNPNFNDE